jgi:putative membrane protein insertion efficiency factor
MVRWLLIQPIRAYRRFLSPLLPPACRFYPSCSVYTMQAIEAWGVWGLWMGAKRIFRCQPFFAGGYDPVPLPAGHPGFGPDGRALPAACGHDHH